MCLILQIEGLDHDARLAAYRKLNPSFWASVVSYGGAALLLQKCFQDLRNPDDLALRHAAAQALQRFIQAVKDTDQGSFSGMEEGRDLVAKVVFPAAKKAINASNLAVRQVSFEHFRISMIGLGSKSMMAEASVMAH